MLRDPVALNSNLGLYTNFVNLLDMSALAVPAGFRANRTGFGVTFIGPAFADRPLQALGRMYEALIDEAPPPLDLKLRTGGSGSRRPA
jgi:allophanate hydrolase